MFGGYRFSMGFWDRGLRSGFEDIGWGLGLGLGLDFLDTELGFGFWDMGLGLDFIQRYVVRVAHMWASTRSSVQSIYDHFSRNDRH